MKKIIFGLILAFIAFLSIQYFLLSGFNLATAEGIIINLISDVLSIAATLFIIDKLLQKNQESNQMKRYLNTLEKRHEVLVTQLINYFNHFVTKDSKIRDIEDVLLNIDDYITSDFLRTSYKTLTFNPNDIFNPIENQISYMVFVEKYFKQRIEETISQYLSRYISIMPPEVTTSLFKIDDLLKSNVLVTPIGLTAEQLGNAKFEPYQFIEPLKEIGIELQKLKEITNKQ